MTKARNIADLGSNDVIETTATGVTVTGEVVSDGLSLGDNDKATFGASDDLQIFHTGSYSAIKDVGTGALYIGGGDFVDIGNSALSETSARFHVNDRVDLYYDNSIKLATTATGVDVTGAITADGLTIDGDSTVDAIELTTSSSFPTTGLTLNANGFSYEMTGSQGKIFRDAGNNKALMYISGQNDLHLYEDTGTTAKFVWDSSAESLGIGTSSPASDLHISSSTAKITLTDSDVSRTSEIYAASDNLVLAADTGNAGADSHIRFEVDNSEKMRVNSSGNLGIGTSSPSAKLDSHSNSVGVRATRASNTDQYIELVGGDGAGLSHINANYQMAFKVGDSERARITSSGTLLVGGSADYGTGRVIITQSADDKGIALADSALSYTSFFHGNSNGTKIGNNHTQPVTFFTNNTERARIDDSGNLLIGTTTAGGVGTTIGNNGTSPLTIYNQNVGNGWTTISFRFSGSQVGQIYTNTNSTVYATSSDYRLKENVTPIPNASDRVKSLKPCRFNFIAEPNTIVDGFIAHEAQEVVPEAVTGTKDAVDAEGNPDYQGIDQSKLVPLLTAALQEALTEIDSLKQRVDALENK